MDQRLTFVTLAVRDLPGARAFYVDGLGWAPSFEVAGEVLFLPMSPTLVLSLWDAEQFEDEAGPAGLAATAPITLAHNVPSPEAVDQVLADAVAAGATLLRPASRRDWGGYSGYFADPEGYRWEVAHNPGPIGVALMQAAGLT